MTIKKVTFAGHSAVFLHADNFVIAIDPWLEGNPLCPPDLANPPAIDLIILTHGHSDHASDAARLAKRYGCKLAATFELAVIMTKEGVPAENVVFMNKGGTKKIGNFSVTLTHAFHSSSYDMKDQTVYAGEPCGVVINDGTKSIYHAGDTALFGDMALIAETYKPEIAFLPIGDTFTMGPREAAQAARILGAKKVFPIHHSTFDMLTGTPEEFIKHCKETFSLKKLEVISLEPGGAAEI